MSRKRKSNRGMEGDNPTPGFVLERETFYNEVIDKPQNSLLYIWGCRKFGSNIWNRRNITICMRMGCSCAEFEKRVEEMRRGRVKGAWERMMEGIEGCLRELGWRLGE